MNFIIGELYFHGNEHILLWLEGGLSLTCWNFGPHCGIVEVVEPLRGEA
jgi:hypothetical protein